MGGCNICPDASPQFKKLRERWKRFGYPSIDSDLEDAFKNIRQDVMANHCKRPPRFGAVVGDFELFKYRQKDKANREGASGGWRFYALFDKASAMLYPIVVYPKKEMEDADTATITAAIKELIRSLRPFV